MKKQNPEKRHYIRVETSILVNYKVLDASKGEEGLTAENVSGSGIKIPVKKKLKLGTLLEVKLKFLNENKATALRAKVIWINHSRSDKKYPYEAGLEFINIDFAQRTKLSNYFQYLDREELLKDI